MENLLHCWSPNVFWGWVLQNLGVISIDVPKTWVSLGVDVLQSKALWGCFPTEDKRAAGCMDLKAF